jgi:NitT/TauT family transport system substrate-binding protein
MIKKNPNTLKAVLRALRKATDKINSDREGSVKIIATEMKTDEALTRDIMALNVYSMEMNDKIYKGMGEFVDFLHSLERIKQKFPAEQVMYTKILEDVDPKLVKWKSPTQVK